VTQKDFTPLTEYIKKKYAPDLNLVDGEFETRHIKKGQTVFSEGMTAHDAYLLKKGSIEISVAVDKKKVVLTTLAEGTVFGEMALVLKAHKRTATAVALEDSKLVVIPKDVFNKYVNVSPRLISTCLFTIAGRLQSTTQKASQSPGVYECISHMMDLFARHGQFELLYDATVATIAGALTRGRPAVAEAISLMENLNLIEIRDMENGNRKIFLREKERFSEKAMNVFSVLREYRENH
jgi:CRP/FNR family cyclic AMP-dependent transcriptional regulator